MNEKDLKKCRDILKDYCKSRTCCIGCPFYEKINFGPDEYLTCELMKIAEFYTEDGYLKILKEE